MLYLGNTNYNNRTDGYNKHFKKRKINKKI
jgi:hypothetical protein